MPPPVSGSRRSSLLGPICLCFTPILIFYVLLVTEMRSVPMYDDYHAILAFVLDLRNQHGWWSKLLYIAAAQHDEYKLVVEHLLTAGVYVVTGHVHFGFLIMTANLMALGIAALFWMNCFSTQQDVSRRLLLFAPVAWLLFQLNYVENLDWAMCGLQTMPVLLFSLASLHFAARSSRSAAFFTSVSVVFACLSSANGFLAAPLAGAMLLLSRRFRAALLLLASTLVALWIFLYRYSSFDPSKLYPKASLVTKLLFFFSFLGGAVENMHHRPVAYSSVLLGLLIFLTVIFGFLQASKNVFVLATATWCLLSAVAVAQGRSYLGAVMSLTGRYKVYSDLLLICSYVLLASRFLNGQKKLPKQRLFLTAVIATTMLFALAADMAGYAFLLKRRNRVTLGLRQYQADPQRNPPEVSLGGEPFGGFEPEFARAILTQALKARIYEIPRSLQ